VSTAVFIRDSSGSHVDTFDNVPSGSKAIDARRSDAVVSALVVFRDSRGDVIGAASVDAQSISSQTLVTCTFDLNSRSSVASVHATIGDSVSTSLGAYTARVAVVEGRNGGRLSLRVNLSGPAGTQNEVEGDLSRATSSSDPVLGGDAHVADGLLTFSCLAANPGSR
jgi:hypothetical protein